MRIELRTVNISWRDPIEEAQAKAGPQRKRRNTRDVTSIVEFGGESCDGTMTRGTGILVEPE
jgi:hypothetical protein